MTTDAIGVGFGTAGLGDACYDVVLLALKAGFRKFDTAEADWWYDQKAVGKALENFYVDQANNDECATGECPWICKDLKISTKIPPWSLTSVADIRSSAARSRAELVGFCEDQVILDEEGRVQEARPYPLDVYYIHAPKCWNGWHPRCTGAPETLELREAWQAMEAVAGIDHSSARVGLSNVSPEELLDIIQFVRDRPADSYPPPRMPDVVQAYADPLRPSPELLRICQEHGIEFVSYSTLGTQHHGTSNPVLTDPIVKELAETHGRSAAEVVLSWALQKGMSVIPRSSKAHHIDQLANLIFQPPFLSEGDITSIDSMSLN
jgi:diketogulonate reductase-like aldo/keto reductase